MILSFCVNFNSFVRSECVTVVFRERCRAVSVVSLGYVNTGVDVDSIVVASFTIAKELELVWIYVRANVAKFE